MFRDSPSVGAAMPHALIRFRSRHRRARDTYLYFWGFEHTGAGQHHRHI